MGYRKVPRITVPDDPAVLGYLAGLIDGEGSISIRKLTPQQKSVNVSHSLAVIIASTNEELMDWLVSTLGTGNVQVRDQRDTWKLTRWWSIHASNAEDLLRAVLPYLIIKRQHAEVALRFREGGRTPNLKNGVPPELLEFREECWRELRELNSRGRAA